ncbi:MAG: hypothetical protein KatS3mg105_1668 [Gemmatales bacterium]|nr:MAG: hypothetical protein KatS3mg105_1668 [Gemmatales bacterium]
MLNVGETPLLVQFSRQAFDLTNTSTVGFGNDSVVFRLGCKKWAEQTPQQSFAKKFACFENAVRPDHRHLASSGRQKMQPGL